MGVKKCVFLFCFLFVHNNNNNINNDDIIQEDKKARWGAKKMIYNWFFLFLFKVEREGERERKMFQIFPKWWRLKNKYIYIDICTNLNYKRKKRKKKIHTCTVSLMTFFKMFPRFVCVCVSWSGEIWIKSYTAHNYLIFRIDSV